MSSCDTPSTAKIIKGEDILLQLTIRYEDKTPYDLTGATVTVKAKIGGVLTTFADPDVDVVLATHGKITLFLNDTVTEQLIAGCDRSPAYFDFDVHIVDGTDTRIVKFRKVVYVEDRLR